MARHTRAGVHRNNAVCTSSQPFLNVVEMFCNTLSYSQSKGSPVCAGGGGPGPLLRLHGQGCHSLGRGGVHGHTFAR